MRRVLPTACAGVRLFGCRLVGRSCRSAIAVSATMAPLIMAPTVVTVTAPMAAVQKDVQERTGQDQQKWPQAEDVCPVLGHEKEAGDEQEPGDGECRSKRGGAGHGVCDSGERDQDGACPAWGPLVAPCAYPDVGMTLHVRRHVVRYPATWRTTRSAIERNRAPSRCRGRREHASCPATGSGTPVRPARRGRSERRHRQLARGHRTGNRVPRCGVPFATA